MKYTTLCLICSALFVAGCVSEKKAAPMDGRIPIASQVDITLKAPKTAGSVSLGTPIDVLTWGQAGITGQNATPHTIGQNELNEVWETNIGKGLDDDHWGIAQPVVDKGIVYTLDADFSLTAVDLKNGKKLWKKKLPLENPTAVKTVGLAYSNNALYAVSGDGTIVCVSLNGTVLWRKNLKTAIRSMPVIYKNVMYLLTATNQVFAFNTKDGQEAWTYKGMPVQTNLLGMGMPAIYKNYAVVPFSNGEVITFNTSDESVVWTEYLSASRSFNRILDLTHVLASPVIEDGIVYLVGNTGKMGAYHLENGKNIWMISVGGSTTPVISGNTIFMIDNKNNLTAIHKKTGKVFWQTALSSQEEGCAVWKGPLLVGDNAIVVSSLGDIVFVDAKTGSEKHRIETDGIAVAPINVDGTVLFLTEDADLLAYR